MKLKKLELEKFKIFNSATFDFNKITILAGANSAGKSTILNALTAVLQGSESRPFPFHFSNYGENVHLGGFKDIITGGVSKDKFSVGITFGTEKSNYYAKGSYRYATNGQQILVDSLEIKDKRASLKIKWEGQDKGYKAFRKISTKNDESRLQSLFLSSFSSFLSEVSDNHEDNKKNETELAETFKQMASSSIDWESVDVKRSKNLLGALQTNVIYKHIIEPYKSAIRVAQNKINYVGPIRPYPSRHYFLQSYQNKMNAQGDNAFQLLIDWSVTDVRKFNKVISSLKFLNLAENLTTNKIKDELVELDIQPIGQKHNVNLSDVGFGLSQILPVIIATVDAKPQSSVLINQPEVHLHPSSQAQLADYFVAESETNDFIIETHSEYLINRLRLLVATKKINKKDISIIYIDNGTSGPIIHNISIDGHGALVNAPESFFDTYYIDNNNLIFAAFEDEDEDEDEDEGEGMMEVKSE